MPTIYLSKAFISFKFLVFCYNFLYRFFQRSNHLLHFRVTSRIVSRDYRPLIRSMDKKILYPSSVEFRVTVAQDSFHVPIKLTYFLFKELDYIATNERIGTDSTGSCQDWASYLDSRACICSPLTSLSKGLQSQLTEYWIIRWEEPFRGVTFVLLCLASGMHHNF